MYVKFCKVKKADESKRRDEGERWVGSHADEATGRMKVEMGRKPDEVEERMKVGMVGT